MSNSYWSKIYRILSIIKRDIQELPLRFICILFSFFKIQNKKIMIDYPYHRETIAVVERLLSENKEYDIVLAGEQSDSNSIRNVKPKTIKYIYELATAGVWIDSVRKRNWVHKRKQQLYIQTWHGAVAMKKVEKDAEDVLPGFYIHSAKKDSRMADYIVAETRQFEKTIKQSFWYNGPIIEGEFKDGMFTPIDKKKVCMSLGIEKESKIVLYAPTFRLDGNIDCYDMDYNLVIKELNKITGMNWKIIIRLHPIVADKRNFIDYNESIINGTTYPKLGDLISLSDIVITDYSSCMFYGYRAMKPVFIYASDFNDYMLKDRGGYFKYEDLPARVSKNTHELISAIEKFDRNTYEKAVVDLNERIGYFENDVMDQIVIIIDKHIKECEKTRT